MQSGRRPRAQAGQSLQGLALHGPVWIRSRFHQKGESLLVRPGQFRDSRQDLEPPFGAHALQPGGQHRHDFFEVPVNPGPRHCGLEAQGIHRVQVFAHQRRDGLFCASANLPQRQDYPVVQPPKTREPTYPRLRSESERHRECPKKHRKGRGPSKPLALTYFDQFCSDKLIQPFGGTFPFQVVIPSPQVVVPRTVSSEPRIER